MIVFTAEAYPWHALRYTPFGFSYHPAYMQYIYSSEARTNALRHRHRPLRVPRLSALLILCVSVCVGSTLAVVVVPFDLALTAHNSELCARAYYAVMCCVYSDTYKRSLSGALIARRVRSTRRQCTAILLLLRGCSFLRESKARVRIIRELCTM